MNIGGPAWQVSVLIRGLDPDQFESQLISGQVADGEADFVDLRDPELPILRVAALGRSIRFGDDFSGGGFGRIYVACLALRGTRRFALSSARCPS